MQNNEINSELKSLYEEYAKTLPQKIADITTLWLQFKQKFELKYNLELASKLHNLHGSAGIYGFEEVGKIAGNLYHEVHGFKYENPDSPQQKAFDDALQKMKDAINLQKPKPAPEKEKTIAIPKNVNLIYLLDDQTEWSQQIIKQITAFGYETLIFKEFEALKEQLNQLIPFALLINFDLITNPFITNLKDKNMANLIYFYFSKIYTIFFAKSGDFNNRLEAVRMGGSSFLTKPFAIEDLLIELDQQKTALHDDIRVLIIDDQVEIANYFSNLLTKEKMVVQVLLKPAQLDEHLHQFKPDLILLDFHMPECNGVELASVIRQQKTYENIPILFLSAEDDRLKQLNAMSIGADDFITKSSNPEHLILNIKNKARRYKKLRSTRIKDNLTGAFKQDYMVQQLEKLLQEQQPLTVAIVTIDNFFIVNNTYGYAAGDQLLTSLYILMRNQLPPSTIIGRYKLENFILIFPTTDVKIAHNEFEKVRQNFDTLLQYVGNKAIKSTCRAGFSAYPNYKTSHELINQADEDLKNAPSRSA